MTEHKTGKMEKPLTAPSLQQGQLLRTQAPQWLAVGRPRAKAGAVTSLSGQAEGQVGAFWPL